MAQKDELSNVIDTCMRHGLNWAECPAYRRILGSDIERSRLVRVPGFRAEMAEEIKQWANEWSVRETGREMFPESGAVTLSEGQLRKVISESIKKVLTERYLEPGTADYETDRIAKALKDTYPQYESFVDEYVYGGYYEQYKKAGGWAIRDGFREFVKRRQRGTVAESSKKR